MRPENDHWGEHMEVRAVVFLNESDGHFFTGYESGAAVRQAAIFELDGTLVGPNKAGVPTKALEMIWHELNIDVPTTEWARQYRAERNRSLSVGDVVVLGETAYAVARTGWKVVALSTEQIHR